MRHPELRSPFIAFIAFIATMIAACGSSGAATAPPLSSSAAAAASVVATQAASPSASASAQAVASPSVSEPTPSCDPACLLMQMQPPALTVPGSLPAGKYTTVNFYPGGMTVKLNDKWSSHEDSTGELALDVAGTHGEGDTIVFWLDMHPVTYDGRPVTGVANTPTAVSDWLHGVRELTVSPAKETTIGQDKLPALVMDIAVSGRCAQRRSGLSDARLRRDLRLPGVLGTVGDLR